MKTIIRGDVFFVNCDKTIGSEQSGTRPVVVIQNNIGNKNSPTVIVAAITSQIKKPMPTHVHVHNPSFWKPSCVLAEQLRTISTSRLKGYICTLDKEDMEKVDKALKISLAID